MTKTVGNTTWEGDFISENGHIICSCGNESFTMAEHLDMTDQAITTYGCNKCGRVVMAVVKREMPW